MAEKLKVRYHPQTVRSNGNIMFPRRWPMRGGVFPSSHPCATDPKPTVMCKCRSKRHDETDYTDVPGEQPESDTPLGRFRARGYWASCFPEGDGMCFDPLDGQTGEQVVRDIEACFDWTVSQ